MFICLAENITTEQEKNEPQAELPELWENNSLNSGYYRLYSGEKRPPELR